jgi:alginate O-acetyltransferase complex protein AlgI
VFVFVMLFTIAVKYLAGRLVGWAVVNDRPEWRNRGVVLSVVACQGVLSYFKYANFAVDQVNQVADQFGIGPVAWTSVALPIGISFYTFQSMSYTIDVARGRTEPLRNPFDFALYVSLFPQLIAGPIVRFHEIAGEMKTRTSRLDDVAEGTARFVYGLTKKVVIADTLAPVADAAFDTPAGDLSAVGAWVGLLAFALQIYFDVSGYSDMAIGLGRIFGFHFPENFRRPYSALSITDFWRRWHITLSNWFRDYLYVPLGGNRGSRHRTSMNLIIVFVATGIWHGANWTFLVWGLVHGGVMLWERARSIAYVDGAPHPALARVRTFVIVLLAWVFFRDTSLSGAFEYFGALAGQGTGLVGGDIVLRTVDLRELAMLAVGIGSVALPRTFFGGQRTSVGRGPRAGAARAALFTIALPVTLLLIVAGTFSPFLYFEF